MKQLHKYKDELKVSGNEIGLLSW